MYYGCTSTHKKLLKAIFLLRNITKNIRIEMLHLFQIYVRIDLYVYWKQILFTTIHKFPFILKLIFFIFFMVHHSWIHEKKFNARGTFLGRVYTRLICNSIYKRTSYVANVDLPQFLVRPVYVIKSTFYLYAFCVDNCLQFFIKTMLGYTKWRLFFSS